MKLSLFVVLAMAVSGAATAPGMTEKGWAAFDACCDDATFNNAVVGAPPACYTAVAALVAEAVGGRRLSTIVTPASLNTACGNAASAAAVSVVCQQQLASVLCGQAPNEKQAVTATSVCTASTFAADMTAKGATTTQQCAAMAKKHCCNDPLFNDLTMVAGVSAACFAPAAIIVGWGLANVPDAANPVDTAIKAACSGATAAATVPVACEGALAKPICGQAPATALAVAAVAACCTPAKTVSKLNDGTVGVSAACFTAVGAIFDEAPPLVQKACGFTIVAPAVITTVPATAAAVSVKCEAAVAKGLCARAAFVPVPVSPVKADSTSVAVSAAVMALSAASALMA